MGTAIDSQRFKTCSRRTEDWPPHKEGYTVLLITRPNPWHETAHYCCNRELPEMLRLLGPHAQQVEELLCKGERLEDVIVTLFGPRKAVDGDI